MIGRTVLGVALLLAPVSPATGIAASTTHRDAARVGCPAAESLVSRARWHRRTLVPGVGLAQARVNDSRGVVSMHVLRVRLTAPGVHIGPLVRSLAERLPLTALAAGRPHLVAAVNTGYFDFITGAPTGPFISSGLATVISTRHQRVVGIGTNGRAAAGNVWLDASIGTSRRRHRVVAVNELDPPTGLSVFTASWGSRAINRHGGIARYVSAAGHTSPLGRYDSLRSTDALVVARGDAASRALRAMGTGSTVTIRQRTRTTAAHPFEQAYGVGSALVVGKHRAVTGFSCDSSNTTQPARTAIGFADSGRTLVIGEVSEHPHTSLHGLDNNQMARFMTELGVSRAYDFDGSGSTELLARLPGSRSLSLLTYPADGAERPMPLGLGVFR